MRTTNSNVRAVQLIMLGTSMRFGGATPGDRFRGPRTSSRRVGGLGRDGTAREQISCMQHVPTIGDTKQTHVATTGKKKTYYHPTTSPPRQKYETPVAQIKRSPPPQMHGYFSKS